MKSIIIVKNTTTDEFFTYERKDLNKARFDAEYLSMNTPYLWYVVRNVLTE